MTQITTVVNFVSNILPGYLPKKTTLGAVAALTALLAGVIFSEAMSTNGALKDVTFARKLPKPLLVIALLIGAYAATVLPGFEAALVPTLLLGASYCVARIVPKI